MPGPVVLDRHAPLRIGEVDARQERPVRPPDDVLRHRREAGQRQDHPEPRLRLRLRARVRECDRPRRLPRAPARKSTGRLLQLLRTDDARAEQHVERGHGVGQRLPPGYVEGRPHAGRAAPTADGGGVGTWQGHPPYAQAVDRPEPHARRHRELDRPTPFRELGRPVQVGGGPPAEDGGRRRQESRAADADGRRVREVRVGVDAAVQPAPGSAAQAVRRQQPVTDDVAPTEDAPGEFRRLPSAWHPPSVPDSVPTHARRPQAANCGERGPPDDVGSPTSPHVATGCRTPDRQRPPHPEGAGAADVSAYLRPWPS